MGKASRKKQERRSQRTMPAPPAPQGDPLDVGSAALETLLRSNAPGDLSLAGAYAFGYLALAGAQIKEDIPDWYHGIDPLDALFLGTVWPKTFTDAMQFANTRDAWLRLLHGTAHGKDIERFVRETVSASEELGMPVDDGTFLLMLTGRLQTVGLDRRRLPRRLLPAQALQGCRAACGPPADLRLPKPPAHAKERVRRFWKDVDEASWAEDTPLAILRDGLRRFQEFGLPVKKESGLLLVALYSALLAKPGESLDDMGDHAWAWAHSVPETSSLVPVLDILAVAPELGLSVAETLGHLFAVPAFTEPIPSHALLWTSSPGLALPRLAFELGIPEVSTVDQTITPDLLDWVGMHARMSLSATVLQSSEDIEDADEADADATAKEPDERWAERREDVREAALRKVRKQSGRPADTNPRFERPVERIWNADGSSTVRIATDTPQGKQLKKAMKGQRAAFREKFGREPGPGDPLFFDPDADEPTRLTKEYFDSMLLEMAERADEMGIDPAFILAWQEVGYVITEETRHMFTTAEVLSFSRAVERHERVAE